MSETFQPRTILQIIKAAGGPGAIATASNGAVSVDAIYKWAHIGIPDRHWVFVMPLADASAEEMLAANISARSSSHSAVSDGPA